MTDVLASEGTHVNQDELIRFNVECHAGPQLHSIFFSRHGGLLMALQQEGRNSCCRSGARPHLWLYLRKGRGAKDRASCHSGPQTNHLLSRLPSFHDSCFSNHRSKKESTKSVCTEIMISSNEVSTCTSFDFGIDAKSSIRLSPSAGTEDTEPACWLWNKF